MKEIDVAIHRIFDQFDARHEEAENRHVADRDDQEIAEIDAERAADKRWVRKQLELVAKAARQQALLDAGILVDALGGTLRDMAEGAK